MIVDRQNKQKQLDNLIEEIMNNEKEKGLERLLARLRAQPLAKEREEFGQMLFRHIDSFTEKEMKRYNELKEILKND